MARDKISYLYVEKKKQNPVFHSAHSVLRLPF